MKKTARFGMSQAWKQPDESSMPQSMQYAATTA